MIPIRDLFAPRDERWFALEGRASARPKRTFLKSALAAEVDFGCGWSRTRGACLTQSLNNFCATPAVGDILKSKINSCVLPFVIDGRCSVGRHDDLISRVGAMSCRVFDGKVGPGSGNH